MQTLVSRVVAFLPAVLLLVVAGWQMIRIQTHDQSPWLGGGFSMFAYVDGEQYRPLIAFAADEPTIRLRIPHELDREAERLKAAPTADRAARFARAMAEGSERTVVVEVWRPVFDASSLTLSAELIARGSSE